MLSFAERKEGEGCGYCGDFRLCSDENIKACARGYTCEYQVNDNNMKSNGTCVKKGKSLLIEGSI